MAEYIERESLMKRFCERCNEEMADSPCEPPDCFAREVIKTITAADAVPVVRCRECKYHNKPPCPMRLSFRWTEDNDFCSYGEREEND